MNGIVKCLHHTIWNSLVKACNSDITQWPYHAAHIFWADHITMWKATRHSPFYMTHSVEPLLPLDIVVLEIDIVMSSSLFHAYYLL